MRTVAGVDVRTVELVWNDGGRSFEVHRVDDGADLTVDGCFDTHPGAGQIAALLDGRAPAPTGCPVALAGVVDAELLYAADDPGRRAYLEGARDILRWVNDPEDAPAGIAALVARITA